METERNNDKRIIRYIAAHAPDDGESRADLVKVYPPAYKSLVNLPDRLALIVQASGPQTTNAAWNITSALYLYAGSFPSGGSLKISTSESSNVYHAVYNNGLLKAG